MRTKLVETNKPEKYIHVVRNVDSGSVSSVSTVFNSIAAGTPVILNLSSAQQPTTYQNGLPAGFEDGLQVVLPASAANNMGLASSLSAQIFHYGVAVSNILYNQLGEVMVHGVYPSAIVARSITRSASTVAWVSIASQAAGQLMTVDTINNAYNTIATSLATHQLSMLPVFLLDSLASFSSTVSSMSNTITWITSSQRVFVREM